MSKAKHTTYRNKKKNIPNLKFQYKYNEKFKYAIFMDKFFRSPYVRDLLFAALLPHSAQYLQKLLNLFSTGCSDFGPTSLKKSKVLS